MAALEAAIHRARVCERMTLFGARTRARWVAGSSPAMTNIWLVIHTHQIEPIRRCDGAAFAAVLSIARAFHVAARPLAVAHQFQTSHHRADLVVQERTRRRVDVHFLAHARHVETVERLHRRLRLTLRGAEGGEIVLTA